MFGGAAASGTAAASTRSKRPLASSLAVDEEVGIHEEGRAVSSLPTASADEATFMLTRVHSGARRASAVSNTVGVGSGVGTAMSAVAGPMNSIAPLGGSPRAPGARAPSSPAAGTLGLLSDSESADLSASSGSAEFAGDENTVSAPECV